MRLYVRRLIMDVSYRYIVRQNYIIGVGDRVVKYFKNKYEKYAVLRRK
jgi:hypothetical protein